MVLKRPKLLEIRDLLADGFSIREIARRTNVHRSTITKYLGQLDSMDLDLDDDLDTDSLAGLDDWLVDGDGPIARCPTCGGKVSMPCKLCSAREWLDHESAKFERMFNDG